MKKALSLLPLFLVALFFSPAAYSQEGRPEYGMPVGTIIVPDGLVGKEVQRAIMESGATQDFIVKTRDDDKVVLYREDGSWTAVLTFAYDTKEIQIYSKSVKSGEAKVPERWIKNLKKDISKKLNTVAITK